MVNVVYIWETEIMNSLILDIADKIKTAENKVVESNGYYYIKDVKVYYDLENNLRIKIKVFDKVESKEKIFILSLEEIEKEGK